jgi:hypothetical protein
MMAALERPSEEKPAIDNVFPSVLFPGVASQTFMFCLNEAQRVLSACRTQDPARVDAPQLREEPLCLGLPRTIHRDACDPGTWTVTCLMCE